MIVFFMCYMIVQSVYITLYHKVTCIISSIQYLYYRHRVRLIVYYTNIALNIKIQTFYRKYIIVDLTASIPFLLLLVLVVCGLLKIKYFFFSLVLFSSLFFIFALSFNDHILFLTQNIFIFLFSRISIPKLVLDNNGNFPDIF